MTDTVVPLVKKFVGLGGSGSAVQTEQMLDALTAVLSVEAVSVLQILGFNLRQAIGQPLTQLVEHAILAKSPTIGDTAEEIKSLALKRETLIYQLALDAEATGRLNKFLGR